MWLVSKHHIPFNGSISILGISQLFDYDIPVLLVKSPIKTPYPPSTCVTCGRASSTSPWPILGRKCMGLCGCANPRYFGRLLINIIKHPYQAIYHPYDATSRDAMESTGGHFMSSDNLSGSSPVTFDHSNLANRSGKNSKNITCQEKWKTMFNTLARDISVPLRNQMLG